jgi:hypothetical protein
VLTKNLKNKEFTMTSQQLVSSQTSVVNSMPKAPNATAQAPQNPSVGGNGGFQWGQSGSGSTAMANACIMEVMDLMTKIQSMNAEQAGDSVNIAGKAAIASYNQNIQAADDNQKAARLDATSSFISGGLGVVGVAANSAMTKNSHMELTKQGEQSKELSGFGDTLSKKPEPAMVAGQSRETVEAHALAARKATNDTANEDRIKDLTTSPENVRKHATAEQKAANEKAIASMTPTEAKEFKENLAKAQESNSKDINNAYTAITSAHNSVDAWKGIATAASTGTIDIFKGIDTKNASTEQAMGQLISSQAQQMYAMYNNQAGQSTQNGQKGLEALQLLAQLAQASSFRG